MVSLIQLWLPIVLSAVFVFVASSLVHMVLRWHNSDYGKLPNEDEVRAAIRKGAPAPAQYVIPHCTDMKQLQSPEMQQKFVDGPNGFLRIYASGKPTMGPMLGKWFALNLAVAFLIAYIAANTLVTGAAAGHVLRVTASIGFLAYAVGSVSEGIWFYKPWRAVAKDLVDALIYGFAGGAAFAWLWPAAAPAA
jgi:hypothetical protein